ncbi:hypothetical protein BSL78_12362 [Apostichopus japonicus]|uniref:Uncharacterized protein n=1 Tax=Stichopus japonicus TaxID=307972 RepID=A0A2G8KRU9_STIJA|nr:hypothetical protein BSL78_12362 [Apostichopus japonicus]
MSTRSGKEYRQTEEATFNPDTKPSGQPAVSDFDLSRLVTAEVRATPQNPQYPALPPPVERDSTFQNSTTPEQPGIYRPRHSHKEDASSVRSSRTGSSRLSTASSAALRAKAKVEAARAELVFARREAELLRQKAMQEAEFINRKASHEAELLILHTEKAAAVASAEAAVYEEAEEVFNLPDQEDCASRRTNDFVQRHFEEPPLQPTVPNRQFPHYTPPFVPGPTQAPTEPASTELTNYLMRKELVSTGLLKFNDKPEHYRSWKVSFTRVARELKLLHSQELDFITTWLGDKSSELVLPIRSIYVHNPAEGLKMTWERLDETYGAPEAIEHALFSRLENFPKLTPQDKSKLQQLSDLSSGITGRERRGHTPGLLWLDTHRGVNPIVEKLPYGLQERWMSRGFKYKIEHNVPFPPFRVFAEFVRQQAKVRNDPSFALNQAAVHQRLDDRVPRRMEIDRPSTSAKWKLTLILVSITPPQSTRQMTQKNSVRFIRCLIRCRNVALQEQGHRRKTGIS